MPVPYRDRPPATADGIEQIGLATLLIDDRPQQALKVKRIGGPRG
jgi:hypothetical protein